MRNQLFIAVSTSILCCAATSSAVYAADTKPAPSRTEMNTMDRNTMGFSAMDANNDGWISKEEYNTYHSSRWERMKKNKDGMVDMKEMGNDATIRGDRNPPGALQDSLKK